MMRLKKGNFWVPSSPSMILMIADDAHRYVCLHDAMALHVSLGSILYI
jgi:hypothetical protein